MDDLLKEAIADAKAVRETALENAKIALEEAFTPRLKSMLAKKIQSEIEDDGIEEDHDDDEEDEVEVDVEEAEDVEIEEPAPEDEEEVEEDVNEEDEEEDEEEEEDEVEESAELDLEAILRELEDDEDVEDEEEDIDENDVSSDIGKADNKVNPKAADSSATGAQGPEGEGSDEPEGEEDDNTEVVDDLVDHKEGEGKVVTEEEEPEDDEEEEEVEEEIDLEEVIAALSEEDEVEETSNKVKALQDELKEHRNVVKYLRTKLNEVNLLNAKLLFTNKLFRAFGLSNDQKMKVVETFDRAHNLREVKLVYSTLAETFNGSSDKKVEIKEHKGSASKAVASTKSEKQGEVLAEGAELKARFQKLAGIL
jgi:hypothetical protein